MQSLCEWQDPNTDQRWQMTAEGFIVNLLSGRCIDVSGVDGIQLVLFDCEWGVQGRPGVVPQLTSRSGASWAGWRRGGPGPDRPARLATNEHRGRRTAVSIAVVTRD